MLTFSNVFDGAVAFSGFKRHQLAFTWNDYGYPQPGSEGSLHRNLVNGSSAKHMAQAGKCIHIMQPSDEAQASGLPNNTPYNDTCPISQQHTEEVHTRKVDDEVPWVLDHLLHCDAICLEHLRLDEDSLHHNMSSSRSGKVGCHRGFMPVGSFEAL